jgi:diguanylate cyclase (GGDEF)-like protein/PAS domain S-box-containing protein
MDMFRVKSSGPALPHFFWMDKKWKLVLAVCAGFVGFWLADSLVQSFVFREGGLVAALTPKGHKLWMRIMFIISVLLLGLYSLFLLNKINQFAAALADALHKNELILDSAGEGICGLDSSGKITFCNAAAVRLTGFELTEMVHFTLHEVIHPKKANGSEYSSVDCPVFQTLKDGRPRQVSDDWFWNKDGKKFPVEYVVTPMGDGSVTGAVVIFRDISIRREAEAALHKTRDFLENLLDNSPDVIGLVDRHGRFTKWNKAGMEVFGYRPEEMIGKSAFEIYADKNELEAMLAQLRRDGYIRKYEIRLRKKDGAVAPFALSIRLLYENGKVAGSICVARDRTEIREAMARLESMNDRLQKEIREREEFQAALQQANNRLQSVVQESEQRNRDISLLNELGDLLQACQNREEAYAAVSQYCSQLFPDNPGGLFVLNHSRDLLEQACYWGKGSMGEEVFAPDDCWAFRRGEIHRVPSSRSGLLCRHLTRAASPADHWCIPMIAQGEILGLLYLQSHLCALPPVADMGGDYQEGAKERLSLALAKQLSLALASLNLRESLRHQAIRDPLTGLFNRRYMEESLEREILRVNRRNAPLGLIMLDLDRFKQFNDAHGHKAGDAMLSAVGNLLKRQVRREDIACRYGGEELLLILPEAAPDVTLERAELLRQLIAQLQTHYQGKVLGPITASLGVASFPEHAQNWEDLIRAADEALYRAKQNGRNRVEVAQTTDRKEIEDLFLAEKVAEVKG